jgi:hypothetical protein
MAPLVAPPPVITLEEAKAIEKKLLGLSEDKAVLRKSVSTRNYFVGLILGNDPNPEVKKFSGQSLVEWAVAEKVATDTDHAVKVGQALLEHRLAHHITDDAEFENSPDQYYVFISQETVQAKMYHTALGKYIAQPELYYQGKLELKSTTLFGFEQWTPVYAVLDEKSASPRMVHLFKSFSAASAPISSYAIEDCISLQECMDCKIDCYCFTLVAKKRQTGKDTTLVMCANHSKRLEGWLAALMDAGVEFTKEEEGNDLKNIKSIFELSARKINSQEIIPLSIFKGKVCLVVNVASK